MKVMKFQDRCVYTTFKLRNNGLKCTQIISLSALILISEYINVFTRSIAWQIMDNFKFISIPAHVLGSWSNKILDTSLLINGDTVNNSLIKPDALYSQTLASGFTFACY